MTQDLLHGRPAVRTKPWPSWPQWDDTERALLSKALDGGAWSAANAPLKLEFEGRWAEMTETSHALGVTNGTISLEIALRVLGIGAGDEVIVPPYTFMATATAVLQVNAIPIFADIDPETYNLDPAAVEAAITERTRAVIVVHLGGQAADLDAIGEICERRGLELIEDAAHAHGATWNGRAVGGFGAFGSWSFQASKNVSSGEGGALTTNREELATAAWELHNCGRKIGGAWYEHYELGGNYRLTEWQCAILLAGLDRLPEQVERREQSAAVLDRDLAEIPGIRPLGRDPRATVHAHHLYLFRYAPEEFAGLSMADFAAALRQHGIPAQEGYPMPIYAQPLFAETNFDRRAVGWDAQDERTRYGDLKLPVTERACQETIWLPHALLLAPAEEMADVVEAVAAVRRDAGR